MCISRAGLTTRHPDITKAAAARVCCCWHCMSARHSREQQQRQQRQQQQQRRQQVERDDTLLIYSCAPVAGRSGHVRRPPQREGRLVLLREGGRAATTRLLLRKGGVFREKRHGFRARNACLSFDVLLLSHLRLDEQGGGRPDQRGGVCQGAQSEVIRAIRCSGSASHHNPR